MTKDYTKEEILAMEPGYDLDQIVHELTDNGDNAHWLHIPDYSTIWLEALELVDDLRKEKQYFEIASESDGYSVKFRGVHIFKEALPEAVSKAFILGTIKYRGANPDGVNRFAKLDENLYWL